RRGGRVGQAGEIAAGAKHPPFCAQQNGAHLGIAIGLRKRFHNLGAAGTRPEAQCIELVGTRQNNMRDAPNDFIPYMLHDGFPTGYCNSMPISRLISVVKRMLSAKIFASSAGVEEVGS